MNMRTLHTKLILLVILTSLLACTSQQSERNSRISEQRWTVEQANAWYDKYPFLAGGNYVLASAINQLEMWQAATFDPERIDFELACASEIGMNTMRVFLHDLAWKQDKEGFFKRVDKFLQISDMHGIKPMFVFF